MQFEVVHEFEAPLDALELAILSPNLIDKIGGRLPNVKEVTQVEHALQAGSLRRVWSFQPDIRVPVFAKPYVTPEMCAWKEESVYSLRTHASEWTIVPTAKPEWAKYFQASGTYALVAGEGGTTQRIVRGEVELNVPSLVRHVGERMIVNEVKKNFEAEAAVLRELATLV